MAGRGRGRGALGRWGPSPGSGYSSEYDGRAVASVPPLKKELDKSSTNDSQMCLVRVTCIIDVNHFWAQLGSDSDLDRFDNYMFALNHWCDNQIPAPLNDMPGVGEVVCVKHMATRTWRRAEVTRLCQRMVDVFFLDFGEAECIPLDMLCSSVPGDITSWPPQALYCTLEGVQPPRGKDQWSEKAVRRFTELVTSGQRISATRDNGNFQLMLYLIDDMGQLKSVGVILAEEGLAQESRRHILASEEDLWHEESPGHAQHDRRTTEKPDIKSLEQQLMMSGFSYLIPNKSEEAAIKTPEGYSYERTTISSSYYSYKGKNEDSQHVLASNNDQEQTGLASQYHSPFKHFHSPITQVLPSSTSLPSITSIRESSRNHPTAIGSHPLSTRPHLASPGEFMSSSKGQTKSPEHEQTIPSNWPSIPTSEETTTNIPFGSTDGISYDSQLHEDRGLKQHTDCSYQEVQDAAAALQQHLEGPSAFHDPKNSQQTFPIPFTIPVKSDKGIISQLQASVLRQHRLTKNQQQLPVSKTLNSQDNEKTMKKELSWQKWKFQRNIKKVLEKMTKENIDDLGYDISTSIADSQLSKNFDGVSEVMLVLEMIVEKVLDKKGFENQGARICYILSGLDILRFSNYFHDVVTTFRDNIVEHYTISDWKQRCQRFSNFMGEMFLNLFLSENDLDESFKSVVNTILKESVEKWSCLDQDKSEEELHVFVVCLSSLLHVIGPSLDDTSRLHDVDIDHIFSSVRDQVLSTTLPSFNPEVKCFRARSLKFDFRFIQAPSTHWDPYAKVHTMLQKLKLENLFENFKQNCIRDSLLVANKDDLKKTLQEAGFPPGVILEIRMYLEKGDLRPATTRNPNQNRSNDMAINSKVPSSLGGQNLEAKEQSTRRNEATLEKSFKPDNEPDKGRSVSLRDNTEEQLSTKQNEEDNANQEDYNRTANEEDSTFDPIEHSYSPNNPSHPNKTDRKRTTLEQTSEDNKAGLIDAHNLFEPSYLSRTLPLKVDTTCYEYEAGPDSPNNQGPKSYSAVVKSKNEEHSPEATTNAIPVKLTSLTRTAVSDGPKDANKGNNKPTFSKVAPKDSIKETSGKRDQGSSLSRPPPGFPPPPPQNWGQSPEIRLTVLNSKQRGRSENGGVGLSSSVIGTPDGRGFRSREGSTMTRSGPLPTRGGGASRGRLDQRWKGGSDDAHPTNQNWQGRSMTGATSNWRQRIDDQNNPRNKLPYRESRFMNKTEGATNISCGGGFSQNKTETLRPFGEGGPKACFNCGSKDHFTCHDRSKMFFD
ncbi:uncharacterized protein LOC116304762 [Actinia tenebrosa]|uniref:Uncharacterized protein LOC116304762 n=1 Tax=Actinia tenebrosa TaxID=6105 RepID=A0A6P8IWQ2_ACTTE|nr:uncharacterized protein LOC116304762 [Actinia tenebrosa]